MDIFTNYPEGTFAIKETNVSKLTAIVALSRNNKHRVRSDEQNPKVFKQLEEFSWLLQVT